MIIVWVQEFNNISSSLLDTNQVIEDNLKKLNLKFHKNLNLNQLEELGFQVNKQLIFQNKFQINN